MSRRKLERLLNLTICLMATSRYLSVREIAGLVDGYEPGESAESEVAFRRMFERDKDELRELGVPLETGTSSAWDDDVGYRIPRRDYALPELHLAADEAAALGLAARLWSSASLAAASASAVRKLRAAGVDPQPPPVGLEPRVDVTEPAFEPCLAAVRDRQAVHFSYRRPGDPAGGEREVEPWGVVSWRGHWYLIGFDRGRQGSRVFRLSRVSGEVLAVGPPQAFVPPPNVDLRAAVEQSEPSDAPVAVARILLRPGTGLALRRRARRVASGDPDPADPGDPADTVELDYRDVERLAEELVGLGPDVAVLEPAELRDSVRRRLQAVLAAAEPALSGSADPDAAR